MQRYCLKLLHTPVHHPEPQRRNDGQQHHAGIAGWHLWRIIMVAKDLVLAADQVMMVAVAAQLKQHHPANDVITVPAMNRHGSFVVAAGEMFALQAVMFNVVQVSSNSIPCTAAVINSNAVISPKVKRTTARKKN